MLLASLLRFWEKSQNAESRRMIVRSISRRYYFPDFSHAIPVLKIAFRSEETLSVRIAAAEGLSLSDPLGAHEYVDFLTSVLKKRGTQQEVLESINALGHIGPVASESIDDLLQCIHREDREVGIAALQALRLMRPTSKWTEQLLDSLSEELFPSLDHWDRHWQKGEVSRMVVYMLADMGREVVPLLVPYLKNPQRILRLIAATVIREVGWAPSAAMSTIVDALTDCDIQKLWSTQGCSPMDITCWFDDGLGSKVADLLPCLDRQEQDPIADFIESGKSDQPIESMNLLDLRRLGKRASVAIPALIEQMQSRKATDYYRREQLAFTIARIAPREPICHQLLCDDNWRVRELTLAGMCQAEDKPEDLVEIIQARILDEEASVRLTAAELLWSVAGQAIPAARAILKELPSSQVISERDHEILDGPPLEWWHREWQELIGPVLNMAQSEPSIVDEVSAAWHAHPESINLARLYWELTRRHDEVVSLCLVKWLRRNELREMVASLELLQRMGPAALGALPVLCDLLKVDFWLYQYYALQVIANIGPAAEGAIDDVLKAMSSRYDQEDAQSTFDRHVSEAAVQTLGKLLPDLPGLEPVMLRVLDNRYVRDLVARSPNHNESTSETKRMLSLLIERLSNHETAVTG